MKNGIRTFFLLSVWFAIGISVFGQGSPISYKGQISEGGSLTSGSFDMEFKLFDTVVVGTGAQKGSTITQLAVVVANGTFGVNLDFGTAVFDGSPRFLEVSVRRSGGSYSTLAPRQQIAAVPYSVHSLNATQLAGVPSSNFLQGNSAGNVGIGTANPAAGVRLEVNGPTRVTPGGSGGFVQIGAPNGETGLNVSGKNRFDLRFDDDTLKLAVAPGNAPPPPQFGITINTNGNVGIGMGSPLAASQWKLEIDGPTRITTSQGAVNFSSPGGEMGMSYLGVSQGRADFRFDGSTLKIVAGSAAGPPSAANGVAITTAGNVGIGTTAPAAKLHVETPETGRAAVYGLATSGASVGVFGSANVGSSVGVWAHNSAGPAIHADGNATQAREKGGFVKAMAHIDPFLPAAQYVVRCFNSQQEGGAASAAPCGIQVFRLGSGNYTIDFGFNLEDRFFSLTPVGRFAGSSGLSAGTIYAVVGNRVSVAFSSLADPEDTTDTQFQILVY